VASAFFLGRVRFTIAAMNSDAQLAQAWQLLQRGDVDAARAVCARALRSDSRNGRCVHLAGLIEKRAGQLQLAEELLRKSVALAPDNAEFHANLGNLLATRGARQDAARAYESAVRFKPSSKPYRLAFIDALREANQLQRAEAEARSLLKIHPADERTTVALADVLKAARQWALAEQCYRDALKINPASGRAHHNLGALLSHLHRSEAALQQLEQAARAGVTGRELFHNQGQTLLQLARLEEAEAAFEKAVQLDPRSIDSLAMLARLRFLRGKPDFAEPVRTAQSSAPTSETATLYATLLWRAGELIRAEAALREITAQYPAHAAAHSTLAYVLIESARYSEAVDAARAACERGPGDVNACNALVSAYLSVGDALSALPIIDANRRAHPLDQRWLAHAAIASRLTDGHLHAQLYDYDRFVFVCEPDVPSGWSSRQAFLTDLRRVLEVRHQAAGLPIDQSLRAGTQTTRSLLADQEAVIQAFLNSLREPLAQYCQQIGTGPHPLTARNSGQAQLVGCWSVRLTGGGFHVNHVHPEGWISSAFYVSVPDDLQVADHQGWLQLGAPRYPVPGIAPERYVQPSDGRLVLFPSYLWHGTVPFESPAARLTIAFDAVPARETLANTIATHG
jgi:Tfp pilus assembly protein PilF